MGKVITLPSGTTIELAPFTGRTERIMEDKKLIHSGEIVNKYLVACIASINGEEGLTPQKKGQAVLDMLSGDRNYLLVQIRIEAYGPEMIFNHQCPQCKETSGYQVNLQEMLDDGTLEVHSYREQPIPIDLPSGGQAELRYMNGHDELREAKVTDERLRNAMIFRTASLNGEPPSHKLFDELSGMDLAAIRGALTELKGGLKASIELDCLECGNTYEVLLSNITDFFIHSRTTPESATA